MRSYNVILLYDKDLTHLLLCKRKKNPYMGKCNLIGGKIEQGESGLDSAYRELFEEANVDRKAVELVYLMDFTYYLRKNRVEVYAGKLKHDVEVSGTENELFWSDLDCDFFDVNLFAGEGNIGHMVEQVKMHADQIFSGNTSG